MDSIKKQRELVWVQILYLYIVPILLLYFKVIPGDYRIMLLLGVAVLLFGIVKHAQWTYADMGIYKSYMKDIFPYFIFTIAGIIFLFIVEELEIGKPFLNWWRNIKFLLLFIPISVLQEVIFRGVLMNMLRRAFKSPVFIIILNASVFALMHVIYLNSIFVLPLTFVAGIGFAWMYYKYENLILISASHTILNFIAMIFGFFIIR
jgi:membrane protease YdiL (CAAX protease family)